MNRLGAYGRADLDMVRRRQVFLALGASAALLSFSLVRQIVPGSIHRVPPSTLPAAVFMFLLLVMAEAFQFVREPHFVEAGLWCLRAGIPYRIPAAIAFWLIKSRGTVLSPRLTGATAGALAGLVGMTVLEVHRPNVDVLHIVTFHLGIVVIGICPQSTYQRRDLDFRLTQISDCVVVSSEVSPAGVINLVNHCWTTVVRLLQAGIMCRGYITQGLVFHTSTQVIGTGYQRAYQNEGKVTAFKRDADERGTPFGEVDKSVCDYIRDCGDSCVQKMFSRSVKADAEVVALFPFKRLAHSFVIAGHQPLDAEKERRSNENVRVMLNRFKDQLMNFVDQSNPSAVRKADHYLGSLDAQLKICDQTDEFLARFISRGDDRS